MYVFECVCVCVCVCTCVYMHVHVCMYTGVRNQQLLCVHCAGGLAE